MLSANAELIQLYWDIGQILVERQTREGYGAAVIPRLARDLRNELPEVKGFSERNMGRMIAFRRAYPARRNSCHRLWQNLPRPRAGPVARRAADPEPGSIVPQPAAQFPANASLLWSIPWGHHAVLLERVKDLDVRLWYMEQTIGHGWSRDVLTLMIKGDAHRRQGRAISNFPERLPPPQSDLVTQSLKDPYIFDVGHDNRVNIADSVSRILGRRYLSRPTTLGSKDDREHSLLVKRWWATKCPAQAVRLAKYGEGYTA